MWCRSRSKMSGRWRGSRVLGESQKWNKQSERALWTSQDTKRYVSLCMKILHFEGLGSWCSVPGVVVFNIAKYCVAFSVSGTIRSVTWCHILSDLFPQQHHCDKHEHRILHFAMCVETLMWVGLRLTYLHLLKFPVIIIIGDCSSTVVKVLCYKSEGHWFDPRWCHGIFHWHKSFW
jgi:hypothetical protein